MPRPRKNRLVDNKPHCDYFCPNMDDTKEHEEIILSVVEIECIRLNNLCKMNQTECAIRMGIHQSTFHRMLNSAREKIADALVNGKAIRIRGGNYVLREDGEEMCAPDNFQGRGPSGKCVCPACGHSMEHERGKPCALEKCPKCGSKLIRK